MFAQEINCILSNNTSHMYWSKTKQQKNKKTRGEKIGSFYHKLVPIQNPLQNNLRKTTRTTASNNKKTLGQKTNIEVDRR